MASKKLFSRHVLRTLALCFSVCCFEISLRAAFMPNGRCRERERAQLGGWDVQWNQQLANNTTIVLRNAVQNYNRIYLILVSPGNNSNRRLNRVKGFREFAFLVCFESKSYVIRAQCMCTWVSVCVCAFFQVKLSCVPLCVCVRVSLWLRRTRQGKLVISELLLLQPLCNRTRTSKQLAPTKLN